MGTERQRRGSAHQQPGSRAIDRRSLLGGAASITGGAVLAASSPAHGAETLRRRHRTSVRDAEATRRPDGTSPPFVLVHGGWHGGWCWQSLAVLLRRAGHDVWTPTLTGLAERAHQLDRDVGLTTHVDDVTALLEFENLRGVVLVGHSYAGMVISGAAERAADRIARLVYLDAFVPDDGQSLLDALPPARREMYLEQARMSGDGWRVPPPPAAAMGITDDAQARWLASKLTDQPLRSFQEPATPATAAADDLPRTYIHCTVGPVAPSFAPFADRFRSNPAWRYRDLATGHDAMLLEPETLAALLLGPDGAADATP